ncbi:uncharacterized protein LOC124457069 [Xenia sp. Carnegie-2017]|uniref:uncharacterized protein LOC124457069 n=1 Tax=Xenia sp. Carnegie-2017 TaxID=2897299 RepID=UPI001F047C2D|nr:uncharacterized protein LOC124457069 [Xenia sp. Carnegie-2017]
MDPESFGVLESLITPLITKKDTNMRRSIPAGERLAVTLRFLATGESYSSLQFLYRIARQTMGRIIPETCDALSKVLKDYIKVPTIEEDWRKVEQAFSERWNFPNCVGALNGKHILLKAPNNSGSFYFNYKNNFSIVLLALVDADYKFLYIDIGKNGRVSDGGVFRESSLSNALETNSLNLPSPTSLPGDVT